MKGMFYPKFALSGIKNNKRFYLPYILTCVGMIMMFYIVNFLAVSKAVGSVSGGENAQMMLRLGAWVIAIFSAAFLFYSNSFLMKRRKKEFGLYNVLGMEKKHIGIILFFEDFFVFLFSSVTGLLFGILFSKLFELGLVRMIGADPSFVFSVSLKRLTFTVAVFAVIFSLLFLNSIRQVRSSEAIALLNSESAGEKPPRANYVLGILGVLILAAAYFLAVSIKEPLSALSLFFVAVIMVIVATYLIMISGSVLLCRILQKNKRYYYKPEHFTSVSSMKYRMKRNGAGLASICILSTMVLVMISSTASLYFGAEDALRERYPKDINVDLNFLSPDAANDSAIDGILKTIEDESERSGIVEISPEYYRWCSFYGLLEKDGSINLDPTEVNNFSASALDSICGFRFIPASDYNRIMNTKLDVKEGEALYFTYRFDESPELIKVGNTPLTLTKKVEKIPTNGIMSADITPSLVLIVKDLPSALSSLANESDTSGDSIVMTKLSYGFDCKADREKQEKLCERLLEVFGTSEAEKQFGITSKAVECREADKGDFFAIFGGLFYLGIVLSIVFVIATVLMLYYKQVTEGYEDVKRFEIMQKIGMTKKDIKRSVASQMKVVFFLPLTAALLHLCFAFPLVKKLLTLFNLNNLPLFILCTAVSFAVFTAMYAAVYRITSRAYVSIVAPAEKK